jgi:ADP-dependent NAD(P)H-hydrate dehydratase / NAD(P)H-hydrate epimerase
MVRTLLPALRDRSDSLAVVVDADALFTLAQWPRGWEALPRGCVLTPHGGEMARLSQTSAEDLRSRSWEIALERAVAWGQIIVLKGAHTVVAAPDGRAWVHPRANPGLATAGTGDVLAGLIGGLAAQGLAAVDAARLAVVAHGLAAGRVLDSRRWRSLIASDLLPEVPAVLRNLSATAGAGAPA